MMCEVCGKYIESGVKVRVEGSVVMACRDCARVGEPVEEVSPGNAGAKRMHGPRKPSRKSESFDIDAAQSVELVEEYGSLIKRAREKRDMKQEDLGQLVNEPASFIHRIESERIRPKKELARKLEKKLKVTLLVPKESLESSEPQSGETRELTLGDLVVVKKKPRP